MRRKKPQRKTSFEDAAAALREHGGNVVKAAKSIGISYNALYDYLNECPELQQVRKEAEVSDEERINFKSYSKLETLIDSDDLSAVEKGLKIALLKSKKSRYYTAPAGQTQDEQASATEMAEMSSKLRDQERMIELLQAKLEGRTRRPRLKDD